MVISIGKRNRQRGNELQREVVTAFHNYGFAAFNRDRGGAQHESGDVEVRCPVNSGFIGCKRRKNIATYLFPEKDEFAVVIRGNRDTPRIIMPLRKYLEVLHEVKRLSEKNDEVTALLQRCVEQE